MDNKKWCIFIFKAIITVLILIALLVIGVDPFFHYHAPISGLGYPITKERYQNDGILKHFSYDSIIIGTSMAENFKTSEFDDLFSANSVKVPFAGAHYKEIDQNIKTAIRSNNQIRFVVRGIDYEKLLMDKDEWRYSKYPEYMYNTNIFDDVNYIYNKDVIINSLRIIQNSKYGAVTTSFDEYANWNDAFCFGKSAVLESYNRLDSKIEMRPFTKEDKIQVEQNVQQNIIDTVENNPNIDFYMFFTPYSIMYWDDLMQKGELNRQLEAEKVAIEMMLSYPNIKLFSFNDDFEMVTDFDNYKDIWHYSEDINSRILYDMKEGNYIINCENYQDYLKREEQYYLNYDYNSLFE